MNPTPQPMKMTIEKGNEGNDDLYEKVMHDMEAQDEGEIVCSICSVQFTEDLFDDEISKLSCGLRHQFHVNCLENWMKGKRECP